MRKALFLIFLMSFLSGCAFSVVDVDVNYRYDRPVPKDYTGIKLSVGGVKDLRNVPNPRIFQNFQNGYGPTTGGLQAEKPLAEIVEAALKDGLGDAHVALGAGDLELTGELIEFKISYVTGVWASSQLGSMTVKLQLINTVSKEIIWRDTFIATGSTPEWWEHGKVLRLTLDDLVGKFLEDAYFQQQVALKDN